MAQPKLWQVVLCAALLAAVVLVCVLVFRSVDAGCAPGTFRLAAVSADSKTCSDIGRDMLRRGGSAADGAIAALLCTSVVNPQSSGLGGGAIFTIREKSGQVKVFSSRETVPQSFKADLLNDCPNKFTFITGSQWVGVPGELRGYQRVHQLYGRLPWAMLFQPSIQLAREGTPLPAFLAHLLSLPPVERLVRGSSLCQCLCNHNQSVLGPGDTLRFPKLAQTLETIAEQGADALYMGQVGLDLIQDIREAGGTLTMEDLGSVRVREADAWSVTLGKTRLHVPPPPAGGAVLGFLLNVMKGFTLTSDSVAGGLTLTPTVQTYHRYVEAAKFANGQKHVIRDPVFNSGKNATYLLDRIRKLISAERTHSPEFYNATRAPDGSGTTHVSALDGDGMAVSVTSTINHIFGSALLSSRTGIILNNQLADFCGRADSLRAGEAPPSSMTPSILETSSGETLVIGGSGGSMITTAVALVVMRHLWMGRSLQDAIADNPDPAPDPAPDPDLDLDLDPAPPGGDETPVDGEAIADPIVFVDSENKLKFEPGFNKTVIAGLKALGHHVDDWKYFFNVVNAVGKKEDCITAVSDRRKMGQASGY